MSGRTMMEDREQVMNGKQNREYTMGRAMMKYRERDGK
jgi:hypothetical protein